MNKLEDVLIKFIDDGNFIIYFLIFSIILYSINEKILFYYLLLVLLSMIYVRFDQIKNILQFYKL